MISGVAGVYRRSEWPISDTTAQCKWEICICKKRK